MSRRRIAKSRDGHVLSNAETRTFDSLRQASAVLDVPLAVLKRLKKTGAAGFRNGRLYGSELAAWLREHPDAIGMSTTTSTSTSTAPTSSQLGAGAALERLEEIERVSFDRLRDALNSGDADAIASARELFIRAGDSLRKYDIAVSESRRRTGETIQRSEAERILTLYSRALDDARMAIINALPVQLAGESEPLAIAVLLDAAICERQLAALASLDKLPDGRGFIPKWAHDAFMLPLKSGNIRNPEELIASRVESLSILIDFALNTNARYI